jgi:hypothetical protein
VPEPGHHPDSCDVCGRTILAGEYTREYLTREGESRAVCELCRTRAEAGGWIRAELAAARPPEREGNGRGIGRMRRLIERARETAAAVGVGIPEGRAAEHAPGAEPGPLPGTEAPPAAAPQPERPPGRTRLYERFQAPGQPRRRRSIPQSPNRRIKRAFDRFNQTEYREMVSGLIRSLGPPSVSAVTSAVAPAEVRITVAWELSWYQWEVDLAGDGLGVRELAKGTELGELEEEDRAWNARATEDGELHLGGGGNGAQR